MSLSLFNSFFNDPFFSGPLSSTTLWKPALDIQELEKEIVLHAEVPGVKKEDLVIEFKNDILTISGEKKEEKKEENEKYHTVERSYGKFSRSVALPKGIKEEEIKAKFDNGLLEISFPKPAPAEPVKKIAIQ